jgi:probable HAF family extracellular repeat protein
MEIKFTTLNDNADPTFNQLLGINNDGKIAGYFGSGTPANVHPNKGYTLDAPYGQGNYHNENFLGSQQTQVTGINNADRTVGFWADANGDNFGFVDHDGTFTDVVDPNAPKSAPGAPTVQQLLGINDKDVAVGFYTDANGNNHGFTYDVKSGSFDAFAIAGFDSTTTTAINNKGDLAGFVTVNGNDVAFLQDGKTLDWLSGPKGAVSVQALGVNNEDQVVGSFTDGNGATHGFLWDKGSNSYTTIDDPNGVKGKTAMTVVNGINDKGQLVGFYLDTHGNTDGMLVQIGDHK